MSLPQHRCRRTTGWGRDRTPGGAGVGHRSVAPSAGNSVKPLEALGGHRRRSRGGAVRVEPDGGDELRYLRQPFSGDVDT